MSKEAFYLHLCKKVLESVPVESMSMALHADLRRAAEGDVPPAWLGPDVVYAPSWDGLGAYHASPPQPRHINWRLAIDQAMTDIERDGSESALAALPWLADWMMIEAKSGMGGDDD